MGIIAALKGRAMCQVKGTFSFVFIFKNKQCGFCYLLPPLWSVFFPLCQGQETACGATEPRQRRKKMWLTIRWGGWVSSLGFPSWLLHGGAVWHCSVFLELRRWRCHVLWRVIHVLWRVISCWLYLPTQIDFGFHVIDFWRTVVELQVHCPTCGRVYKHGPSASHSPRVPCVRFIWVI